MSSSSERFHPLPLSSGYTRSAEVGQKERQGATDKAVKLRRSVRSSFHTTICVLERLLAFETAEPDRW
jgi:hypothetical protein